MKSKWGFDLGGMQEEIGLKIKNFESKYNVQPTTIAIDEGMYMELLRTEFITPFTYDIIRSCKTRRFMGLKIKVLANHLHKNEFYVGIL